MKHEEKRVPSNQERQLLVEAAYECFAGGWPGTLTNQGAAGEIGTIGGKGPHLHQGGDP